MIVDRPAPLSSAALLDEARRLLDLDARSEAESQAIHQRAIALALIAIAERLGQR